jgi:hypothetical protein
MLNFAGRLSLGTFAHTISHCKSQGKCDANSCVRKCLEIISLNMVSFFACWKLCRRFVLGTSAHTFSHSRSLGKCYVETSAQKFVRRISAEWCSMFVDMCFMGARTQRAPEISWRAFPLSIERGNALVGRSLCMILAQGPP